MVRRLLILLLVCLGAAAALAPSAQAMSVHTLQAKLVSLGYLTSGQASGINDYATSQAVMAFQGWQGLDRDGSVGPITTRAFSSARRPHGFSDVHGRRVEIHIQKQVLLMIDSSGAVREAVHISSAAPGHWTPHGSFYVQRKYLSSYSVPFHVWLPLASYFTGGYAMHEYPYVPGYPASHGCVRVSSPFAHTVYDFATVGTPVIIR